MLTRYQSRSHVCDLLHFLLQMRTFAFDPYLVARQDVLTCMTRVSCICICGTEQSSSATVIKHVCFVLCRVCRHYHLVASCRHQPSVHADCSISRIALLQVSPASAHMAWASCVPTQLWPWRSSQATTSSPCAATGCKPTRASTVTVAALHTVCRTLGEYHDTHSCSTYVVVSWTMFRRGSKYS